ncbi:uncharacterized protein YjbJ (UPF0337 family) [Bradyrhizobium sp. GM7.3]
MDKDRIVGSAKEFAGRAEGAIGDLASDTQTQASGKAREAAGSVQNLYGQAKDAVRDATDTAASYAKDAYDKPAETLRDGSQAIWPRRCRTTRWARCWSPAASALHWHC